VLYLMTKMNGETLPFFPIPYPDETIYSVLCRLHLRMGRPPYRHLCEKLFGRRIVLNTYAPQGIGRLVSYLPPGSMLSVEYLIRQTTMFPYLAPFLSRERSDTFLEYMTGEETLKRNTFSGMGLSSMRRAKYLNLRFCESCWRDDIKIWGEPYWRRLHQLPGVLMCPQHREPLWDSPILITLANREFCPASLDMAEESTMCGSFDSGLAEKLAALSKNSQWLLDNGHLYGPYEKIYASYDLWLRKSGYSSMNGRVWHNRIHQAAIDLFGRDFLKLVEADDEGIATTWTKRIIFAPSNLQHPMYHILLHILLAGSTAEFFNGDCQKFLPYGEGPWPCRNTICPHKGVDVIKNIDIHYVSGVPRALFKCPYCGFAYRRQHPVSKEKQYTGRVNVQSYGELWQQKLREYIVDEGLSARRTCERLGCDMYTVQKYAVQFGYMKPEDATPYTKVKKCIPKTAPNNKAALTESEKRDMWRQTWEHLVADNPDANRTVLMKLSPACYIWLWKNDRSWFDKHLPPPRNASHFDWEARDTEILERVQEAVNILRNTKDRPIWITLHRIAVQIGFIQMKAKKSLSQMPKTAAFISENLETPEDWQKRKIVWAIRILRELGQPLTVCRIMDTAVIKYPLAPALHDFILESMEQKV